MRETSPVHVTAVETVAAADLLAALRTRPAHATASRGPTPRARLTLETLDTGRARAGPELRAARRRRAGAAAAGGARAVRRRPVRSRRCRAGHHGRGHRSRCCRRSWRSRTSRTATTVLLVADGLHRVSAARATGPAADRRRRARRRPGRPVLRLPADGRLGRGRGARRAARGPAEEGLPAAATATRRCSATSTPSSRACSSSGRGRTPRTCAPDQYGPRMPLPAELSTALSVAEAVRGGR